LQFFSGKGSDFYFFSFWQKESPKKKKDIKKMKNKTLAISGDMVGFFFVLVFFSFFFFNFVMEPKG
jgi:hypothetical protein